MRVEITIPRDRQYVERLFQCLDYIESDPTPKNLRLRKFIMGEFREIRAKYNGNPRLDFEAIIEQELNTPVEKPVYVNTRMDKMKVARFDPKLETAVDKVARIIRAKKNA